MLPVHISTKNSEHWVSGHWLEPKVMTTAVRVGNNHWDLIKLDAVLYFSSLICWVYQKHKWWRDLQLNLKIPVSKELSNPAEKNWRGMGGRRFLTNTSQQEGTSLEQWGWLIPEANFQGERQTVPQLKDGAISRRYSSVLNRRVAGWTLWPECVSYRRSD